MNFYIFCKFVYEISTLPVCRVNVSVGVCSPLLEILNHFTKFTQTFMSISDT